MPHMRYRPEEIISKSSEAEVLLGQGKEVPEAVKAIGISEANRYGWSAKEVGREEEWEARHTGSRRGT